MKLRRMLALFCITALLFLPSAILASEGKEMTVKGEVLDLACYVSNDAQGGEHSKCAVKCVKSGQPMGLKAADGTVYVLFADHDDASAYDSAKDFAGQEVELKGVMSSRGGLEGITVHGVTAL
jgi:hypothetical protein